MHPAALALVVYSAQILFLISVATVAGAFLCRRMVAAKRLAYWRVVGILCLLLPLLAPVRHEPIAMSVAFASVSVADQQALIVNPAPPAMNVGIL